MSEITLSQSLSQKRPYRNFINSLPAEETKKSYTYCLQEFLSHYFPGNSLSITILEDLLSYPVDKTENMIIDYLLFLRKKDLSSGYIGIHFWTLNHFYSMNDVRLNTFKLQKFFVNITMVPNLPVDGCSVFFRPHLLHIFSKSSSRCAEFMSIITYNYAVPLR